MREVATTYPEPLDESRNISVEGYTKAQLACVLATELSLLGFPITHVEGSNVISIVGDKRTYKLTVSIPRG